MSIATQAYVMGRFLGAASLLVAALTGTIRDLWWLWLIFWLTTEASLFVTERLVYWQRRHIEGLKESDRLDDDERARERAHWWNQGAKYERRRATYTEDR